MAIRTVSKGFSAGELTPEMWGRIDDGKYAFGLATCRNFDILPHGPAANRAGFAFVLATKNNGVAKLIAFTYSTTQTMVLEFGQNYIRFHTQGGTLLNAGVPYEVVTDYQAADLFSIHYTQSADVLTLVHPLYPPRELRRLGAVNWTLVAIGFASSLAAPTGVSAVATVGTGATTYTYKVIAVGTSGIDKSLASSSASTTNNLLTTGNFNTITWSAVTGATRYNIYKQGNGLYGYIGQTDGLTFKDDNITADISSTPPEAVNPFSGAGDYPGAVAYFEQRRWFGGTINKPQNFWATRAGTESDMSYSIPTRDDDSLSFRVAAREANTIRHLVPLTTMVMLTSAAEWRLTSINTDAVTPNSVSVRPQSYIGANNAQPVIVNNNLVYVASRGGHAREMAYSNSIQFSGYITGDLSLRAPHLFDGLDVVDMAYSKAPYPYVWMVSSNGTLLGLTYIPEQQIGAWHRHDTLNGSFESCCCVAEGTEDVLYVVVSRTVNGAPVRYIERRASRRFATQADAFFVDSGATYSGAPVSSISGLTWLEGETVSILADGAVHASRVVTGGAVPLDAPASKVQVGLPITADIETLPAAAMEVQGAGQGRLKNVNKVWMRVVRSGGIFAGPTFDKLREHKQRTNEPYGTPPALVTDEIELVLTPAWASAGQVCVRQTAPLPLTLTNMTLEMEFGG